MAKFRIEATIDGFEIDDKKMSLSLKGTTKYSFESIFGAKKEKITFNLLEKIEPKGDIKGIISKEKVNVEVGKASIPTLEYLLDHIFSERKKMVFTLLEKTAGIYTLSEVAHLSG